MSKRLFMGSTLDDNGLRSTTVPLVVASYNF
jgi:hypothetical protein